MHDLVHKLFHNRVIMGIIRFGHTSSFEKKMFNGLNG
jgi:hypothetical protein